MSPHTVARTPEKLLAGLVAAFAIHGFEVHELADGGYLLCRRGLTKHCPSIEHLQAAARQLGVAA